MLRLRNAFAIGCVSVVLLGSAAAVLIARRWPTITSYYHRAAATVAMLNRAVSALQTRYGGTVNVSVMYQAGAADPLLRVTLTNPPLLDQIDPEGSSGRQKALEIAAAAREALLPDGRYEHYEVVFVRQRGVGVTLTRTWANRFEASELECRGCAPSSVTAPSTAEAVAPGPEQLLGAWRGTSLCTNRVAAPACHDEQVVYRFTRGQKAGMVHWAADKIVDGRLEAMGELDVSYDAPERCWKTEYHSPRVSTVWRLSVDGAHMTGSARLLPGNAQIRALDLRRD